MASSIIRGKHVITRVIDDNASEVIDDGAVYQEDGAIVEVGSFQDLNGRYSPDEVVGDGTQLAMPGLVNAHHHVGLTPFQLGSPDLALEPWIVVRTMNRDVDNYLDTLYCAIQMIESGITTVMHNHATWRKTEGGGFHDSGAHVMQAYQDAGMRVAFSFSHRDQNRVAYEDDERFLATLPPDLAARISRRLVESQMSTEEYVGLFEDLSRDFGDDPRIRVFLSPGNVQWCSDVFSGGGERGGGTSRDGDSHSSPGELLSEVVRHTDLGEDPAGSPGRPGVHGAGGLLRSRGLDHGVGHPDYGGDGDYGVPQRQLQPATEERCRTAEPDACPRGGRGAGDRRGGHQRRQRHDSGDAAGPQDSPGAGGL